MSNSYYKLWFDDTWPEAAICTEFDLCGFNEYELTKVKPIQFWPENIKFFFDRGHPEDYLGNALGWLVFSHRIQQALLQANISEVEFLPIMVFNRVTGESVLDYAVVNILVALDALDRQRAKYIDHGPSAGLVVIKPVLKKTSVEGHNIFRLKEQIVTVIISEKIKNILEAINATGFKYIPIPTA